MDRDTNPVRKVHITISYSVYRKFHQIVYKLTWSRVPNGLAGRQVSLTRSSKKGGMLESLFQL